VTTDFPTASVGSSQAPTAAVEKSQSASHTEILTPPEALSAWLQDMDEYYQNNRLPVPTSPNWKNVAEPNLVIVQSVTRSNMEQATELLVRSGQVASLIPE